ncbi:MAG: hypothetical protein WDM89_20705 [Rhizomicrobium sp.]
MLILHIGTHKTGTSSLQSVLTQRADALREKGVRYIEAARENRIAHHPLAWAIRGRRGAALTVWDDVRRELQNAAEPVKLLSTEGFWFEDPDAIKEQLAWSGPVRIVAYVRRQDKYLQSLYKQTVASGRKTDFDKWLKDVPHRGDYYSVIARWADTFGERAITLLPYERSGRTIDVVEDFLRVLNLDPGPLLAGRKYPQNPSPRRELLHFLRAFNQLNLKMDHEKFFYSVIQRNKAYVRSTDLLSAERCAALLEDHAESNRKLAERFWHDETMPLFPAFVPHGLPQQWGLDDPEFFTLTVDVLKAVVKFLDGENEPRKKKRKTAKPP